MANGHTNTLKCLLPNGSEIPMVKKVVINPLFPWEEATATIEVYINELDLCILKQHLTLDRSDDENA